MLFHTRRKRESFERSVLRPGRFELALNQMKFARPQRAKFPPRVLRDGLAQCHTFPLRLRYPQPAFSNSMTLRCQPKKRAVFSRWEKTPSHETRASPPGQSESAQARFRPPRARLRRLHPEILR